MTINGVNIEKYGARQMTVDIQPAQDAATVEWIDNALTPTEGTTTTTFSTLEVVLLVKGSDPGRITQSIAEIMQLLTSGAELSLDGYRDKYRAWYQTSKIEKIQRSKHHRKLTLTFQGYLHSDLVTKTYTGVTEATVKRLGARPTPVILTVTTEQDMDTFTVEGLTDDPITISNLMMGIPIIIDGRDGTAEENGENKGTDVSLWEPPALRSKTVALRFSSAAATVTIKYWPIWL